MARIYLSALLFFLISQPSLAFYTVQDTGELLKPEENQLSGEVQFITSGDEGVNAIAIYDRGIDEESNLRVTAGAGTTDVVIGAFYKWVPYPDFDKQPAIGFIFGAHYAHYEDENELAGRIIPLVSKKFDSDLGLFTPYIAVPVALSNYDDDTNAPIQLVLGSRFRHHNFDHFDFNAELGFDINDSFAYISIGAIFPAF